MRLTTKGRFAVTAMIDLALRSQNGPVALAAISQRQQISLSYLEQLFGKLRRADLVASTRGPGGGYYLGRPAEEITIADIICAVDEWVEFTRCSGNKDCQDGKTCLTHNLWEDLSRDIYNFLKNITIAELIRRGGYEVGGCRKDENSPCPKAKEKFSGAA